MTKGENFPAALGRRGGRLKNDILLDPGTWSRTRDQVNYVFGGVVVVRRVYKRRAYIPDMGTAPDLNFSNTLFRSLSAFKMSANDVPQ